MAPKKAAPKKAAPKKALPKKAAPKRVTVVPPPIIIQLQVLFSQTPGVNRWTPIHPVTRATITETGGLSVVTNSVGSASIARSALAPGAHTLQVAADASQAATVPAGPTLGSGAATDPAFMFRPFTLTIQVDATGIAATPAPSITLTAVTGAPPHARIFSQTPTLLVVDWKADWIKTANQTAPATGKTNSCLVLHQTSTIERIGNHLNTFTTPASEASAHYLVDTDGHVVKLVHESRISWHAGASFWQGATGVNNFSVGIEIVHTDDPTAHNFTDPQYAALLRITPLIRTAFPGITRQRVVGHSDIEIRGAEKRTPPLPSLFHFQHGSSRPNDPGRMFEWNRLEAARIARQPVAITSLTPNTAPAGGPSLIRPPLTLTVNGTGFAAGAVVQWAGTALPTTFVNATTLTAVVPANLTANPGTPLVTVVSGGAPTPGVNFVVTAPGPAVAPAPLAIYGITAGHTLAAGAPHGPNISELKQDLLAIGHPISDSDGVTVTDVFDAPLTGAVARFQTRHFSGTRRTAFTGTLGIVDFPTALAIKQVLADAGP